MKQEDIARVCHEVNRAYCQALGDMSQPAWKDAPQRQKDSATLGVKLHAEKNVGPEASHESWMAQKVVDGWVYGPEKNPDAKTHPCIVPFDVLPREQQAKDFIFRAVVHALRSTAPQPVKREPLTDEEFLQLLLKKGTTELVSWTTFVGESIQMQGKIGLRRGAKLLKEFVESAHGITKE